jgi:hypothetical protein
MVIRLVYRSDTTHPTDHSTGLCCNCLRLCNSRDGEVNTLRNVITMALDLHTDFVAFQLWLEPVRGQVS